MTAPHRDKRPSPIEGDAYLDRNPKHGIARDERGQDQPTDKSRAQQSDKSRQTAGEKAQRDAATTQQQSPGEPAGGE